MHSRGGRSGARGRDVVTPTSGPAPMLDLHAWVLTLVVLLLTAGVIAMHSLGTSHHPGAASATLAHVDAAAPGAMASHSGHETLDLLVPVAMPTLLTGHAEGAPCAPCSRSISENNLSIEDAMMGDHGLTAMCLAVIPLLALLLRPAWKGWFRLAGHLPNGSPPATRTHPQRSVVTSMSLSRLCVLRT